MKNKHCSSIPGIAEKEEIFKRIKITLKNFFWFKGWVAQYDEAVLHVPPVLTAHLKQSLGDLFQRTIFCGFH